MRRPTTWLVLLWAAPLTPPAEGHDGPPYPICVDEVVGPVELSIWADPDVGEGTFYYYIDPPDMGIGVEARASLGGVGELDVQSSSVTPRAGAPYQQIGTLLFQQRGVWSTTFTLTRSGASLGHVELDVEVTPPGMGRLYLLWYAIPFLAAVAVWLRIFSASSRPPALTTALPATPSENDSPA